MIQKNTVSRSKRNKRTKYKWKRHQRFDRYRTLHISRKTYFYQQQCEKCRYAHKSSATALARNGKNPLESFDVHGCQTVFTRCWFDNTISNMGFYEPCCKYTVMQNQVNVSAICDPNRYGCTIIPYQPKSSNKEQTDTKLHLLRKHTKGDGIPLILYAIGMTDEEIKNGNYKRLIDVMFDGFVNGTKTVSPSKYTEFMDIYYINVVSPDRNWEFPKYEWPTEFLKIEPLYRENLKEFYNQEELEKIGKDITYLGHAVGTTLSIENYNSNSDSDYMWERLPATNRFYLSKPFNFIYSNGHSNTTREMQMKGYGDETLFSVTSVNEITNESCEDLILNGHFGHLVDYVSPVSSRQSMLKF